MDALDELIDASNLPFFNSDRSYALQHDKSRNP
jgi:hypothetical protein